MYSQESLNGLSQEYLKQYGWPMIQLVSGTLEPLQSCIPEGMGGGGGGVGGILAAVLSWFSPLAQLKPRPEDREHYHEPDHHNVI